MATTPVNGATTGTTQTTSNSSTDFSTQFANTMQSVILNMAIQNMQDLQGLLGTDPQSLSDGD